MTTQLVGPEVPVFEGDLEQPDAPSIALLARVLGRSGTGLACGVPLADAERIDRLSALEDLKAAASAAQALLAAELDTSRRVAEGERGVPAAEQGRGVAHEVALARRESPHAGGRLLGLGKALVREMPHTLEALRSGAISEWRATLLVRETACLTREDRATVDRELAGTPEAAAELGRKGTRAIVAAAQRIAYRLDPQAVVDRSSRAARDRHVSLRPAPDCMALISALVPVAQGVATYAALKAEADAARAAGARILGAAPQQGRWVRRLFVRPTSGQLVSAESRQRRFPAGIAQLVALVHPTCRTPWCDAPAVHADHVVDHARGGVTALSNAQGLCEACNHAKSLPGWRASPVGEGNGPPVAVVTTTPTGHVYESGRGP